MNRKICIVTTRHISYNPRVLKEADALAAQGYRVSVVTINSNSAQRRFDEELMTGRSWQLRTVNFRKEEPGERSRWLRFSIRQRIFAFLAGMTPRFGIAERAMEKAFDALTTLACSEKADLYIVHHAEALGIGAKAARRNRAALGFDAEDFHTGMNESSVPSREEALAEYLERRYLPSCIYLTAASKGIALAYHEKYGIRIPDVILNVFPFESLAVQTVNNPVRFYWYSQVIGPNRGLELLLDAAGRLSGIFEIHLRGSLDPSYRNQLDEICGRSGIQDRVFFHEPILAEEIIREANRYDIGLALESDISVNRNICVTNKIFSYLMSRLLIIGTDTWGQKDIFTAFPDAVSICHMNDAADLARAMQSCLDDRQKIQQAKLAADEVVTKTFNWALESEKLLKHVNELLKDRD